MNKFKLWEIETLWEKYFVKEVKERKLAEPIFAPEKIKDNYKNGVSKFHPNFFLVEDFDFTTSKKPVFENTENDDRSGEGKKEFYGLEKQQLVLQKNKKPVYLVDNHNKALFSFLEVSEVFSKIFDIVHIDAHRDDAKFQKDYPEKVSRENINWCLENSRVSDYLDLAKKSNLIGKIFNITQEKEFEDFLQDFSEGKILQKNSFILSLDIDVFGPEGDYIDTETKIKTIAKAWKNSSAVVIATSPGYISGKDAQGVIEIFMKK
jgi:hypothetical protein